MAYSDKVLDHYENPRNVGSFAKDEPNVGTGIVGAPLHERFVQFIGLTPMQYLTNWRMQIASRLLTLRRPL